MSHRKPPLPPHYRTPQPGTCRWCNAPVRNAKGEATKGTWHPACVDAFKLIHWPAVTRAAVYARDKGICARCGCDSERVYRRYNRAQWGTVSPRVHYSDPRWEGLKARYLARQPLLKALLAKRRATMRAAGWNSNGAWQHDHIRPLIEANGDISYWGLDNCQTLCTPCHLAKGLEDNRRRKEARLSATQPALL
jgi:5-methylcytosine-specific restriction endonuclease McrA